MAELFLLLQLLVLILVANGAPILAYKLLPNVGACPVDLGTRFFDGRPLLGESKTIRGLISSFVCTVILAPILGLNISIGIVISAGAMVGDLLSSFAKRRLGLQASDRALVLDQVPESLIPILFVYEYVDLSIIDTIILVSAFVVLELVLSPILFRLNIRRRPY